MVDLKKNFTSKKYEIIFKNSCKTFISYLAARLRFKTIFQILKFLYQKYPTNRFILIFTYLFDPNTIRRKIRYEIKNNKIQIKFNTGEIFNLNLNEHVDYITFLNGSFDDLYINLIQELSKKTQSRWKFIDIGANFGSIAIPISKRFEVLAFEPQVELFNRLAEHSHINICSSLRIENFALSSDEVVNKTKGVMRLYRPPGNSGATSYNPDWNPSRAGSEVMEVKVITLDNFIRDNSLSGLQFNTILKIDVEGMELHVLQGAVNFIISSRPIIVLEYRMDLLKEGSDGLLKFLEVLPKYTKKRLSVNKKTGKIDVQNWNSNMTSFELALLPNEYLAYF
jgi:FkbM family methyltransferase